jgi:metallophosphoesterase superfamily enzyme
VHPAAIVGGRGPGTLRLPCFHFGATVGVLPAFGEFTGSHVLPRAPGDRVFVIAGEALRELPAPRAGSRALHCDR